MRERKTRASLDKAAREHRCNLDAEFGALVCRRIGELLGLDDPTALRHFSAALQEYDTGERSLPSMLAYIERLALIAV